MRPLESDQVSALHAACRRFGPTAARGKRRLLAECSRRALTRRHAVVDYHDALLFIAAHPDEAAIAKAAAAELARVAAALPDLARTPATEKALRNSGLPGTLMQTRYSMDLLQWLVEHFPDDVEVAWRRGAAGAALAELLEHLVPLAERDGLLSPGLSTEAWVRRARTGAPSDAAWILQRLRLLIEDEHLREHVFELSRVRIRWRLTDPAVSRTLLRFPTRRVFLQRGELKRSFSVPGVLRRQLPKANPLPRRDARRLIDLGRLTLAVRDRETDPVTWANEREVTSFSLERGIDVVLYGLRPDRRLPLESYFGYVAVRNGVPLAYGGAWILGQRAEIGIHLFAAFRGGESAFLFAQVMRVYGHYYGPHRFQVDPYQFGAGNAEAIGSGAFWFYYRLGFRPKQPALRELADAEASSLARDRGRRTPEETLLKLTRSPLILDAPGPVFDDPPDLAGIGLAVTAGLTERFGTNREEAAGWARRRVQRVLRPGRTSGWPAAERRSFEALCPLIALLPGVGEWSATDQRSLVTIMRAKGGERERDYVRAVRRHPRLLAALRAFAS